LISGLETGPISMLHTIFTLDYEIHGNGEGCSYDLIVEPTARMLNLFDQYGAKLTIMADVAEILKFREYKEQFGTDAYHYSAIEDQLRDAIRRGHDVQLHIHASYFNSRYSHGRWQQDWAEYNFATLPFARIDESLRLGKEYLETLLRPVDTSYKCNVFRAANWAVSPSRNIIHALHRNGFKIDTSVFKYGTRNGIVTFDYSNAPSNLVPWRVDPEDICKENNAGHILELPIYTEQRWVGAFLTPQRVYRAWQTKRHRIASSEIAPAPGHESAKRHRNVKLRKMLSFFTQRHAWKADFNQCSGRQLIRALERADRTHRNRDKCLPFVLIGHSKLFNPYNQRTLEPFLEHVKQHPQRFKFGTFHPFLDYTETSATHCSDTCHSRDQRRQLS